MRACPKRSIKLSSPEASDPNKASCEPALPAQTSPPGSGQSQQDQEHEATHRAARRRPSTAAKSATGKATSSSAPYALGNRHPRRTGQPLHPLVELPNGYKAPQLRDALTARFLVCRRVPQVAHLGPGPEMTLHDEFRALSGVDVYFCQPHSPWQRPTNENTNGLVRQYFPKHTDLSEHDQAVLDRVAPELNQRPRLGPRRPHARRGSGKLPRQQSNTHVRSHRLKPPRLEGPVLPRHHRLDDPVGDPGHVSLDTLAP